MTGQEPVILSDEVLMGRLIYGDKEAFTILLKRYQKYIVNFISRLIKNNADSEDLAQEVFLKIYLKPDRFDTNAHFKPWLYKVATNICFDYFRDKNRQVEKVQIDEKDSIADTSKRADEISVDQEKENCIKKLINVLPDKQRVPLIMSVYQNMKYSEIAETLGISTGTVKSRIYYGLQILKEKHKKNELFVST